MKMCFSLAENGTSEQISGGFSAKVGQFPYQVSIQLYNQHICGGSIIHSNWVLTAAHCAEGRNAWNFQVVTGTNLINGVGGLIYRVLQIILHEGYDPVTNVNDIALFRIAGRMLFNWKTRPIQLSSFISPPGTSCVGSGWGYLNDVGPPSSYLQYIPMQIVDLRQCRSIYLNFNTQYVVRHTNVCAYSSPAKGFCTGDSGGPLVCNNVQYGIVSFGSACKASYPDVLTNVAFYLRWIVMKTAM